MTFKITTFVILQLKSTDQLKLLPLHPFAASLGIDPAQALSFKLADYLELADWTARIVRTDKRGAKFEQLPPILLRLGLDSASFLSMMQAQSLKRGYVIGQIARLKSFAEHLELNRREGLGLTMICTSS